MTPGANDNDTNLGDGTFEDNSSTTPVSRYQASKQRGASGPRFPKSNQSTNMMRHYDAPQPYSNIQTHSQFSPERAMSSNAPSGKAFIPQTNNFMSSAEFLEASDNFGLAAQKQTRVLTS